MFTDKAQALPNLDFMHQEDADAQGHHPIDRLHQIVIVDGDGMPLQHTETVDTNIAQFKRLYPGATHTLWTGAMLREFLTKHFDSDVLWAYDSLMPYAYKCDFARYCLLFSLGGLYSDLSLVHETPWRIPKAFHIAAFKEYDFTKPYCFEITNGLIWALPHARTLERAIHRIVQHCRSRFAGTRRTDPTGPGLLGWAWASQYADEWQRQNEDHQYLGVTEFVGALRFLPTGEHATAIAQRPYRPPGDPRYLGANGTNDYAKMWLAGDIYR